MFDAFLLAAGHGTRLRPLTTVIPKPLVPVCGIPILGYALALCRAHGMERVIVNAHYLPDAVVRWAADQGVEVSVETPHILGTGGGLRAVADRLAERVVVVNGDTLCDVDLSALRRAVPNGGCALALRPNPEEARERYGVVATDAERVIVDLKSMARAEPKGPVRTDSHFTGIHALDRRVLSALPEGESCIVRQGYLRLVPERLVRAVHHEGTWLDIGDPAAYLDANLAVLGGAVSLPLNPFDGADSRGADGQSFIGGGARVTGSVARSVVGAGADVPADAAIEDCVVWDGVRVSAGRWRRVVFWGGAPLAVDEAPKTVLTPG
jgi:NDP-sugar pyrophosphorylase family protein